MFKTFEELTKPNLSKHGKLLTQVQYFTPSERDCMSSVPWAAWNPLSKSFSERIEFISYGCGHRKYRTDKGYTEDQIKHRIRNGISWGKSVGYLCPDCFTSYIMKPLPYLPEPVDSTIYGRVFL